MMPLVNLPYTPPIWTVQMYKQTEARCLLPTQSTGHHMVPGDKPPLHPMLTLHPINLSSSRPTLHHTTLPISSNNHSIQYSNPRQRTQASPPRRCNPVSTILRHPTTTTAHLNRQRRPITGHRWLKTPYVMRHHPVRDLCREDRLSPCKREIAHTNRRTTLCDTCATLEEVVYILKVILYYCLNWTWVLISQEGNLLLCFSSYWSIWGIVYVMSIYCVAMINQRRTQISYQGSSRKWLC